MTKPSRRDLLRFAGLTPLVVWLDPLRALGQSAGPRRFVQIFLEGGWDSILATDPVVEGGAKATGGKYQAAYYTPADAQYAGAPVTVKGKANLVVGPGLAAAAPAFALAPTAFVNGMFVEVTAHQLATNYLYSGTQSLSNSREYPAVIATMADAKAGFPAHVILGDPIPLGATRASNPPFQAGDTDAYVKMMAGPYKALGSFKQPTIDAAQALITALNGEYQKRLASNQIVSLNAWDNAEAGLTAFYAKRYDQTLAPPAKMLADFGAGTSTTSVGAKLAMALTTLSHGVTPFVTVNFSGFDTHRDHMATHLPLQKTFAAALNAFVSYLATTADPDAPSSKLLETTTVLVTSEFTRTPLFNLDQGTDHRQTASAIMMGRGVKDDVVVGSTDAAGAAADYEGQKLLPDHLAASILRMMGYATEANGVSTVNLDALFS